MYHNVNNYLITLSDMNVIKLKNIFNKSLLLNNLRGIYSYSSNLEYIEFDAIYCTLLLTGNIQLAHTVLYCNYNTTDEEIISFIYRSIKCQLNSLFIIMKPEELVIGRKNLLIELLKNLYSQNPEKMKSCLLFIYIKNNETKDIIKEIKRLPKHKNLVFENDETDKIKNTKIPNIEIYSSESCGLGKSTLIKKHFNQEEYNDYEYVYFPIDGNTNKNEIMKKLLPLTNRKIKLHLDLYDFKDIEIIKEFLFSFLILKYYSYNECIFYYGEEIKIKIEIPNSFIDYKLMFPIFKFFNEINITNNNLPDLEVSMDLNSNIQILCNYLKNIDIIDKYDIYIEGISNELSKENIIIAEPLEQSECSNLIFNNFLNINNPNYYQINSFINIVSEQLRLFSNSYYMNIKSLEDNGISNNNIRSFFIKSLIAVTKYFITSSYDNIIKGQNKTNEIQNEFINMEKVNEIAIEILKNRNIFSYKSIRPSVILINEDKQSISVIITCEENTEEYEILKSLYNGYQEEIIKYKKLSTYKFLIEVRKVLDLYNRINSNDNEFPKTFNGKELKYLEDIVKSYVFTEDNFIKLILISLRIRASIPIIMMGETGCGKTSLIKIIAKLKNIKMITFNIHAGIEVKDIIDFLKKYKLFENENLNNIENLEYGTDQNNDDSENSDDNEQDDIFENKNELWIFLDEINTCNSLGLITEIILKSKINIEVDNIGLNYEAEDTEKNAVIDNETRHFVRRLVYTVNPLPHSLLNYVYDFGMPDENDIKGYINNMVIRILTNLKVNNKIKKNFENFRNTTVEVLFYAHQFINEHYGVSSVSLREIRRWEILFRWFILFLNKKYLLKHLRLINENNIYNYYKIYIYSLNLSIYLCYYLRIYEREVREKFKRSMKDKFSSIVNDFEFEKVPKSIQNIIANEVYLDEGIARNKALLENLFSIFVCLNTKIPLFIIGKPGCSKTLSAQLIFKSMNGKYSSRKFFRSFPKVYTKSYQGSLNSKSKGILNVFKKAEDSLKMAKNSKQNEDIIIAIYFDEMGLAEISKNNPLKVIHSKLEYDDNKRKVSFIGISNWSLDASKMNRGIYISIPELDEIDLKMTALSISESYNNNKLMVYNKYFENLAYSYYEYKKELNNNSHKFIISKDYINKYIKEFHGTRDFYYLIKTVSKLFIKADFPDNEYEIYNIINESIERNFGGLEKSISIFKQIFKKYVPNFNENVTYDVINYIKNNIEDSKSRYLMIITKCSLSHYLITSLLKKWGKKYEFYHGSNFKKDNSEGYYSAKVLNKIQITISNENVMILKNLTILYPSLYDLFNQNFRKVGNDNYARIVLELINCDIDEIQGLIYQLYDNNNNLNKEKNELLYILNKIVPTFSQDLIFYLKYSTAAKKYKNEIESIKDIYLNEEDQHKNLKCYLENINSNKHIIYTYSNILDSTLFGINNKIKKINNKKYKSFTEEKTINIFVNQYDSENEIEEIISNCYSDNKFNLYLFHFDTDDYLNNINNNNNIKKEYLISHLSDWKQFFIDDLNGINISIKYLIDASNVELFNNSNLINLNDEFKKDYLNAFKYIKYNFKINFSNIKNEEYIKNICELFNKSNEIKELFNEFINKQIENIKQKISFENYSLLSSIRKEINIYLGLSNPCIISILRKNVNYINLLVEQNKYIYNSENFENIKYLEKKVIKETESILINNYYNNILNMWSKDSKLIKYFFNDYIIYFLSKSNNIFSNKNILKFFNTLYKIFISKKINENNYEKIDLSFENILKFVLFLEFYKDYIFIIVEFISFMELYIKNYIKNITQIILEKEFKSSSDINIIQFIFYNILEPVVYCKLKIEEELPKENIELIFNKLNSFSQIIMNIKHEFYIKDIKLIYYLFDFIKFQEICSKSGILLDDNLENHLKILKQEANTYILIMNNNNKNNSSITDETLIFSMEKLIEKEFNFLDKTLKENSNVENYSDFIVCLINNKIKIIKTDKYRLILLKKLCSNNKFISKSKIIFQTILNQFNICPLNIRLYNNNKDSNENKNRNEKNNNKNSDNEDINSGSSDYYNSESNNDNNECSSNEDINSGSSDFYISESNNDNSNNECSSDEDSNSENSSNESINNNRNNEDNNNISFIKQIQKNKNSEIIKFLNKTNNMYLDGILMSFFETEFLYCLEYENNNLKNLYDQFKTFINYIEENYEDNNFKIKNDNKLCILYSVSYIKYFCFYYTKFIYDNFDKEKIKKDDIISFLKNSSEQKRQFRKIVKIYILKILNLVIIKDYKEFLKCINRINLFNDDFNFTEKVPSTLDYLFIDNESINYYLQLKKSYNNAKIAKFKNLNNILDLLNKNDNNCYINLFDLLINEELSNINFEYDSENWIYSEILSEKVISNLKEIYIPGGEPNDSLLIKSGYQIEKHINSGKTGGIYICNFSNINPCYNWYVVDRCTYPMEKRICEMCGKEIGGENHIPVKRDGHIRIYKDEQQRNGAPVKVSNKLLSDIMKKVEEERNVQIKGFKPVQYSFFVDKNKKVRNMCNITYRILSFIFYSCIFYNIRLGYLNKNEIEVFYCSDANNNNKSIISILENIWQILTDELLERNVGNIQCFLNLIITKLKFIIFNNKLSLKTPEEREIFEKECDKIIENEILNYNKNYEIYNKNNKDLLKIQDDTIKSILQETSTISNLSENDYPLIKYFNISIYPNFKQFTEQFNKIQNMNEKYPVIFSYLSACIYNEGIKYLENFKLINPLIVYVLEKYKDKYSRNQAKEEITIGNELKNDEQMQLLFNDFKKGWENIYNKFENYDCHGNLEPYMITESSPLAYILNDKYEDGFGKYIATAYKGFITYQNEFLYPLITHNSVHNYLYSYSNQISKRIIVQKANPETIVSLNIKNNHFNSFNDIINTFSYKECYQENNENINYLYNIKNSFDYESIEIELANILLPEKRIVNGEETLSDELKSIPGNIIKLDNQFLNIFKDSTLKLNKLADFYEYVEYKNFDNILNIVSKKAFEKLDENQVKNIKNHFKNENLLISKKDLKTAVRKYISRYLISDQLNNFELNIILLLQYKPELWKENINSSENKEMFENEIEQLKSFKILVKHSVELFKILNYKKKNKTNKNNWDKIDERRRHRMLD
ncbi:hypothetical protein BCR32DRAFT_244734 [Anaeromyces robustus]|uniref:RZ-type domain-containing protein n=1 Tax=Anaeromyces robustus TaxID=1754192 RepID=A0A1Y1X7C6_9FUNG|nr:hypothetical protein BCR32DRAFT_244734 [Anaeromyces robustus]|eukprot:ORX81683.1 hypothetical protein BCR32DRAFT_244734 [Anaeromyces robustus]